MRSFLDGAGFLLQGMRLIVQPGLKRYAVVPLLINGVVFSLLIALSIDGFGALIDWMLPDGQAFWTAALRALLWIVFAAAAALVLFLTFTLVANLIGAPFNGMLAEKAEMHLTGKAPVQGVSFLASIPRSLKSELRKLLYTLAWAAVILPVSFIPVVQTVFPVIWALFSGWVLALEYLGYPMENHGFAFRRVRALAAGQRMACLGFGIAVTGITLIPIVNFIAMPAAVAGATCLWTARFRDAAAAQDTERPKSPEVSISKTP